MYESYSQDKLPIKYLKELSFLSHSAKYIRGGLQKRPLLLQFAGFF